MALAGRVTLERYSSNKKLLLLNNAQQKSYSQQMMCEFLCDHRIVQIYIWPSKSSKRYIHDGQLCFAFTRAHSRSGVTPLSAYSLLCAVSLRGCSNIYRKPSGGDHIRNTIEPTHKHSKFIYTTGTTCSG